MSSVAERLHKWAVEELNLVSEGCLTRIPDPSNLCHLTKSSNNKEIWLYVINHVRSRSTVQKVRRTLLLKRRMEEREGCNVYSLNERMNSDSVQLSVSKADEKRTFLENSISDIQGRIVNTEESVRNIKGDVSKMNQNFALLELLFQQYKEKCESSRIIQNELVAHLNKLKGNRNALPNPITNDWPLNCNLKIREVFSAFTQFTINKFEQQDKENENCTILKQNLKNEIVEVRDNIIPIHFIILLKKLCDASLDTSATLAFQKGSAQAKKESNSVQKLVSHLKHNHVFNALAVRKKSDTVLKLLIEKDKFLCDKLKSSGTNCNDPDFLLKCELFEKLADEVGCVARNKYLAEYIKNEQNEAEILIRKNKEEKQQCQDLYCLAENFYNKLELVNWLISTASTVFHHIHDDVEMLYLFAHNEVFLPKTFLLKEYITKIEECLKSEMKSMCVYSEKADLIKPVISQLAAIRCSLSDSALKSLDLYPFQNIALLCNKWAYIKRELCGNMSTREHICGNEDLPDISQKYITTLEMLQVMKQFINKTSQYVSDGNEKNARIKVLLEEWYEQKAQFIPIIEYEGKALKIWVDILGVLSDSCSPNYPCEST